VLEDLELYVPRLTGNSRIHFTTPVNKKYRGDSKARAPTVSHIWQPTTLVSLVGPGRARWVWPGRRVQPPSSRTTDPFPLHFSQRTARITGATREGASAATEKAP
jgi:hypothetical protein